MLHLRSSTACIHAHTHAHMLNLPNNTFLGKSDPSSDLEELVAIMPQFGCSFIKAVYHLSNLDFAATFNCLHNKGGTLETVLELMREKLPVVGENEDPPRIWIKSDKIEDWVEAAFLFYKSQPFLKSFTSIVISQSWD